MPHLVSWARQYGSQGLVIIGNHVQKASDAELRAVCRSGCKQGALKVEFQGNDFERLQPEVDPPGIEGHGSLRPFKEIAPDGAADRICAFHPRSTARRVGFVESQNDGV